MSDNDQTVAPTGKVIAEGDHKFILCMLSHVTGGNIAVDINAVATELGYGNPKSAANKMAKVKKDYGIPFITGKPSAAGVVSSGGDGDKSAPVKAPGRTKLPSAKPPTKTKAEKKTPSKRGPPPPEDDEDEAAEVEEQPTPKKLKKSPVKKEAKTPKEPKTRTPAKPKVPKTPTKTPAKAKATPNVKKSAVKAASEEEDADVSEGDVSTKEDVTDQEDESVSEEIKSKSESQVDASQEQEAEDDDA